MRQREERSSRRGRWAARGITVLLGLVAAALALGIATLVAAFVGPNSSPVVAVGGAGIDLVPSALKDFATSTFGTSDKLVLQVAVGVVLAILAAVAGLLARRRPAAGVTLVAVMGIIGAVAAATRFRVADATPSVVAGVVGAVALWVLARLYHRSTAKPAATEQPPAEEPATTEHSRRTALATGAGMAVVAGAGFGFGGMLAGKQGEVTASRSKVRFPKPHDPAKPLPAGYKFDVPGLTPWRTSNADFYRIDYDLTVPRVPVQQWSLKIHGGVDHPVELSYRDLLNRPLIERDMTLCCVSNPIGGPYVSTTRWLGVSLPALLREAGLHSGVDQLLAKSTDGMTIGTPTDLIMDGREAMLVVGMNGKPLPVEHGFPVRVIVPGLYGYASATKWVSELKLTTFAAESAYWVKRGYVRVGTARTASRIDVPKPFANVKPGPVTVAGIAWALHRGISRVQIRVDNGPWADAELTTEVSTNLWRQWRHTWHATPGSHQIQVRATDGHGQVQEEHRMGVFPSGATGWPSLSVTVTG